MTRSGNIVALDVGNSAIKVAVAKRCDVQPGPIECVSEGPVASQSFFLDESGWGERLCDWLGQRVPGGTMSCWVSTVNRAATQPLYEVLSRSFVGVNLQDQWNELGWKDVPILVDVDAPHLVGIDRLLSAYAAYLRFDAPIIVVDAGSAVTVDLLRVDSSGQPVFAGGAIFPGIQLQHDALASGTEALERTRSREQSGTPRDAEGTKTRSDAALRPAKNTEKAIRLGVVATVAGGIERLARDYAREYAQPDQSFKQECGDPSESQPHLALTGGDGPFISRFLRAKHDFVPQLVCSALMDLATRQCQIAPSGLK